MSRVTVTVLESAAAIWHMMNLNMSRCALRRRRRAADSNGAAPDDTEPGPGLLLEDLKPGLWLTGLPRTGPHTSHWQFPAGHWRQLRVSPSSSEDIELEVAGTVPARANFKLNH